MQAALQQDGASSTRRGALRLGAVLLGAAGLVSRVLPLVDGRRLFTQWPSEDGYFMLTMARNIALGHGLSVSAGEIPTNGTQPLTTLLWSLGFLISDGAREGGLRFALVTEIIIAALTALVTSRLFFLAFRERFDNDKLARSYGLFAGALWFASPASVPHTMNCLESGFATLMLLVSTLLFLGGQPDSKLSPSLWSYRRTVLFGVVLGVAFWVRNDASIAIAAFCIVYFVPALSRPTERVARMSRILVFGATSVLVASPWLVYNQIYFGHFIPVSGRAEALTGEFAGSLTGIPVVLVEYAIAILPVPNAVSEHPATTALSTAFLGAIAWFVWRARKGQSQQAQTLMLVLAVFLAGMIAFYGFYFGARWFLPRYFLPIAPFGAVGLVALAASLLERRRLGRWCFLPNGGSRATETCHCVELRCGIPSVFLGRSPCEHTPLAPRSTHRSKNTSLLGLWVNQLLVVGLALVMTYPLIRQYRLGSVHLHSQVVRWVDEHVPEDVWVGAIQTGTLGFFHDRTINLDGKVNVDAYNAIIQGREGEYVVNDTEIQYLADWIGMRDWLTKPIIRESFEIVVEDREANLCVLRRRAAH